jgi:hypothetical protein
MTTAKRSQRRLTVIPADDADIGRLAKDNPRLALRARAVIGLIATGEITGAPLQLMASYGDLTDCRKVYFGVTDTPTHRLVYQIVGEGSKARLEVVEVVAVEAGAEGYVYLLAAHRLNRLPAESLPELGRVHQREIARRSSNKH